LPPRPLPAAAAITVAVTTAVTIVPNIAVSNAADKDELLPQFRFQSLRA